MEFFTRITVVAAAAGAACFAFDASASCQQTQSGIGKKFVCSDGTIQHIAIHDKNVVIRTYDPDTKSWSEQRVPAIDGLSLDQVSIAIQSSG